MYNVVNIITGLIRACYRSPGLIVTLSHSWTLSMSMTHRITHTPSTHGIPISQSWCKNPAESNNALCSTALPHKHLDAWIHLLGNCIHPLTTVRGHSWKWTMWKFIHPEQFLGLNFFYNWKMRAQQKKMTDSLFLQLRIILMSRFENVVTNYCHEFEHWLTHNHIVSALWNSWHSTPLLGHCHILHPLSLLQKEECNTAFTLLTISDHKLSYLQCINAVFV